MTKRSRWQPPYPDPAKSYQRHQHAEMVTEALRKSLMKHVKCSATGCANSADPASAQAGIPLCTDHVTAIMNAYPIDAVCRTCEGQRAREDRLAAERAQTLRTESGTIYYLGVDGSIKIGWTADLDQRMRAYPPTAEVLALEPGTRALERSRHQQFNEYLSHGREWFDPGKFLLEHISRLVQEHGQPPAVATLRTPEKQSIPHRMKQRQRGSYKSTSSHDGSAAVKRSAA